MFKLITKDICLLIKMIEADITTSYYKAIPNGALAPTERFASKPHWNTSPLMVSGTVHPGFSSAFSQRIEWLTIRNIEGRFSDLLRPQTVPKDQNEKRSLPRIIMASMKISGVVENGRGNLKNKKTQAHIKKSQEEVHHA